MNAIVQPPIAGEVLGEARNGEDILAVWRAAKERIGLSNAHCDELANFIGGHTDKILGPTGAKNFGPLSFTSLNWTLAIKWVAVLDLEQIKVMEQYWEDRQRDASNVRREPNRISKKLIERAKPHVLKGFSEMGNAARQALLPSEQRIKIAKKAARKSSRLKGLTPEQRKAIAKKAAAARWSKREMVTA